MITISNTYWSTYVQTSEELYESRKLRFTESNKDLWLKALKVKSNSSVLEVGCGSGLFCLRIKSFIPSIHITGLDRDQNHINFATEKAKEKNLNCNFITGDAHNLPFKSNSLDLCYSYTVFDFCDPNKFVNEQRRVLKTGGKIALMNVGGGINSESWKPQQENSEKHLFDKLWNEARKNTLSNIPKNGVKIAQYPSLLQQAGFNNINLDTFSIITYAPDNITINKKTALKQINENRLSQLHSVKKAKLLAPNALTVAEYQELTKLINEKYDSRIEQYNSGVRLWDYSTSNIFIVTGTK